MEMSKELPYDECRRLLAEETVGRVAICTADGPQIVPVNYVVDGESIVFRTAPYNVVGSNADGARLALEVDQLDHEGRTGWSVVAAGPGTLITDHVEIASLREHGGPRPWAGGARPLHVRLTWHRLTGRRIGSPRPPVGRRTSSRVSG